MNILLADDELPLLSFLKRGLEAEGYTCDTISDLHSILTFVEKHQPKIVVLDRLFGKQDSITIVESLKRLPEPPKILMLTALDDVRDRVAGLQEGADDYLCKPFDFDELLARITALKRQLSSNSDYDKKTLICGSLELRTEQRIALLNNIEIGLTKVEYDLLEYFVENKQIVLTRERILRRVWSTNTDPLTNIIDVYISRLRNKLREEDAITIQTLRGTGYRLNLEEDK